MNAVEVIEAQADLLYRLTAVRTSKARAADGPPLLRYLYHLAERSMDDEQVATFLTDTTVKGVGWARAYRVQENMTAEINRRAFGYAPTDTVTAERMPPRAHGIAYLEEPLAFRNHQGVKQLCHWVAWAGLTVDRSTGATGAVISMWNDILVQPDEQIALTWADQGAKVQNSPDDDSQIRRFRSVLSGYDGHRQVFGRWAPITIGYMTMGAQIEEGHWATRLIVALWELLGETVPAGPAGESTERTDEHMPRTVARRAKREGLAAPAVTTVVLRRQSRPVINPGTGTPWDSRVWIEPYEGWRWVGPRHDRRKVRRTIAGHWSVNNEELPVRNRKIVSELRR